MVRSRAFRISLLLIIATWFGVVVPAHPRGAIKLGSGKACCATTHRGGEGDSKSKPSSENCAVCQFVATLDVPPAIGMDAPQMGLLAWVTLTAPESIEWSCVSDATSARGPPAA